MSVIAKVVTLSPLEMTQFSRQVIIRLISLLIKDISRVLQKLPKYFNGTATSAFIIPAVLVLFENHNLHLNDPDSVITELLNGGSSLKNWLFQIILNNYHYKNHYIY